MNGQGKGNKVKGRWVEGWPLNTGLSKQFRLSKLSNMEPLKFLSKEMTQSNLCFRKMNVFIAYKVD